MIDPASDLVEFLRVSHVPHTSTVKSKLARVQVYPPFMIVFVESAPILAVVHGGFVAVI